MRRTLTRAALLLLLGVVAVVALPMQPRPVAAQLKGAPKADAGPQPEGFQSFTFPVERDASQRLDAVIDYMKKKTIPWEIVCGTSQQLLDAKSDSFYAVKDPETNKETGARVSVKAKINEVIGDLPKEGKQFYELTYGGTADALLKDAVLAGYDRAILADVSQRYFHTKAGGQATLVLASLNLDAGNYAEAAYGFSRLLGRPGGDEFLTPRVLFKAAVAFKRSGDPRQAEGASKLIDRLEKKFPRDGLAVGRRTYTLDELKAQLDKGVELGAFTGDGLVTQRYGNPSHTAVGVGGTPFLDPSFAVPLLYRTDGTYKEGADWVRQNLEAALKVVDPARRQVALPGFFPVTAPGLILYRTYDGVYAVVAKDGFVANGKTHQAGELFWLSEAQGGAQTLKGDDTRGSLVTSWWANFWLRVQPSVLFDNAAAGSLSHDGKNAYFVDDLAIPPPANVFNPNMGGFQPVPGGGQPGLGGGVTEYSRLYAVSLDTGSVKWFLGGLPESQLTDEEEAKTTSTRRLTEGAYFLGPPLPLNGKLYVLFERNRQIKLACLDPSKIVDVPAVGTKKPERYPELVWVQSLGSPNTPMLQDSLRRIQPSYLAAADGVLVCPTNAGAVVGVDINARSLLWARYYGTTAAPAVGPGGKMVPQPLGGIQGQPGQGQMQFDRWRAAAPIVVGNRVIVTAYDSDKIQCVDLRSGEELWHDTRKKDDLYVGGVVGDKVVVVGKESVRAYTVTGTPDKQPVLAWQNLRIGTPSGHGVASKDGLFYVPVVGNPDQKNATEPQVWAIDVASGQVKSKTQLRRKDAGPADPRLAIGNLVFHEGQLFSQTAEEVAAFPLIELKRQEMARRLAANPNDPEGLADRGELSLDNGDIKEAIADFQASRKNNPPPHVSRKIDDKLRVAYTEILRKDFAAGEPYLDEYKALCDIKIDPDLSDTEKAQKMDERVRWKGLYLALVAKGREKQGRLADAFAAYREFAAIGDSKQLVDIHDEPNAKTRPDVWARGRIDAMMRNAKDPKVRKPLEDRVQKDWEAVKGSNDLDKVREFVKVFGPFFAVGREAQLFLSEKLMTSTGEDDLRDAQTNLMQLWATSEDDAHAARAVEALARLMVRRGMLEDAVGLYAQLNSRYPAVVVRDGKTGAEIYGDLITNRTLLPYLEPGRGPTTGKYKVEGQLGQQNRGYVQAFSFTPEGELFPFYRRFVFTMQMDPTGNNRWSMAVADRTTGEERCKFAGLESFMNPYGGIQAAPSYRVAQGHGSLLLVTLGTWAYCLDLAEKRKVWEYNLLGAAAPPINPNNPPRMEQQEDGEAVYIYPEDGWTLRLGRSAVLQPTYVCLVTREGLVGLDPANGQKLWVRTNVSNKVQVFGDARHVYLIDGGSAKVLRAMDGSPVEGVKDFAGVYASKGRLAVIGRQILVTEGAGIDGGPKVLRLYDPLTGEDVWKKEYPAGSRTIKTLVPAETTGCLTPDGRLEVLDSRTGQVLSHARLDADRLKEHTENVTEPLVLADAERLYLFLNRGAAGNQQQLYGSMLRTVRVNGVAYGFDRATGKRLWFTERLFETQNVFLDRFDELPVILAYGSEVNPETRQTMYPVAVLDKQLGKLRYHRSVAQMQPFTALTIDPRTRAAELFRYDLRVRITPDDDGTK